MTYFRPEIEDMAGYVPGEQPQTDEFVKLNTNENPYPCSAAVTQAVEETLRRGLGKYPHPMGQPFREKAAKTMSSECPSRVETSRPLSTSHIFAVLSELPVSNSSPLGEKATAPTEPECPLRVRVSRAPWGSHTFAIWS